MDEILKILSDIKPECNFGASGNFTEDGFLDSFDIITLVSELESKYNILIDALDIVPENFSSVSGIAALIVKNGGTV